MRIIVISDTHIPKRARKFPQRLIASLETADLIFHAGDWQTENVYHELSQYASVIGVSGNVDSPELCKKLNTKEIINVNGLKIGIVHGHGRGKTTEKRAVEAFRPDEVDCIIFGHSHIPVLKKVNGTILFNPGSATDKRRQENYPFGIIKMEDKPEFHHVFYDSED